MYGLILRASPPTHSEATATHQYSHAIPPFSPKLTRSSQIPGVSHFHGRSTPRPSARDPSASRSTHEPLDHRLRILRDFDLRLQLLCASMLSLETRSDPVQRGCVGGATVRGVGRISFRGGSAGCQGEGDGGDSCRSRLMRSKVMRRESVERSTRCDAATWLYVGNRRKRSAGTHDMRNTSLAMWCGNRNSLASYKAVSSLQ